jgi:hypothetical protein
MLAIGRMTRRASLTWRGHAALFTPCPAADSGHSHVRSICKQTLAIARHTQIGTLFHLHNIN